MSDTPVPPGPATPASPGPGTPVPATPAPETPVPETPVPEEPAPDPKEGVEPAEPEAPEAELDINDIVETRSGSGPPTPEKPARDINDVVKPGTPQTATSSGAGTPSGTESFELKLADTRQSIAFFLLWITAGVIAAPVLATVVFSGWCWLNKDSCESAGTALDLLSRNMSQYVTAMIGLVGSVVGFYFGSNTRPTTTSSSGSGSGSGGGSSGEGAGGQN